jgi:hypothetical protein
VNYTPSHSWWFCWNDWNIDPIKQDLDAIAGLGADHLRIFLIWPFFQPNATWVPMPTVRRSVPICRLVATFSRGLGIVPSA